MEYIQIKKLSRSLAKFVQLFYRNLAITMIFKAFLKRIERRKFKAKMKNGGLYNIIFFRIRGKGLNLHKIHKNHIRHAVTFKHFSCVK